MKYFYVLLASLCLMITSREVTAQSLGTASNVTIPGNNGNTTGNLILGNSSVGSRNLRLFYNLSFDNGYIDVKTPNSSNGLLFRVNSDNVDRVRMKIAANGRVGINTENPLAALDVAGTNIILTTENNSGKFAALGESGGPVGTNCSLYGYRAQTGISSTGANSVNLGVQTDGTSILNWGNTSKTLQIRNGTQSSGCGTVVATFSNSGFATAQNVVVGGRASAVSGFWTVEPTSTSFSKDAYQMIEIPTDRIMGISNLQDADENLVIDSKSLSRMVPSAVAVDEEGQTLINYSAVTPLLIEGFKEQQLAIEELRALVMNQVQMISQLQQQINKNTIGSSDPSVINRRVSLEAYPNPSTEQAFVKYEISGELGEAFLKVYSMDGKVMSTRPLKQASGSESFSVKNLANGSYIYALIVDNQILERKIVAVQK